MANRGHGREIVSVGSCVSQVEPYFTEGWKAFLKIPWNQNLKEVRSEPHGCWEKGILGEGTAGSENLE